jgi:hypothetical protein
MAFKRATPAATPSHEELTARMVGIGMNFAAASEPDADIEATLLHASAVGMDGHDYRVLSVLTTWFGVHHPYVNADRLVRLVKSHPSERVRSYWAALGRWQSKDRRFARLAKAYRGAPRELLPVGNAFQIGRRGEDDRFAKSKLLVPAGTLRDRPEDVLTPRELAKRHAGYRYRLIIGPTPRADVWTALEREPGLSVSEAARRADCSFATAWQVAQDSRLLSDTAL